MIGFKQLVGCCTPSTTPVYGPAFPGEGKINFQGTASVSFFLDSSKFYASATANTLCDSYNLLVWDGTSGEALSGSASINETSSALASVNQGSYVGGIRWKYYSGNFTITDKYLSQDASFGTLIGSKETVFSSGTHYATIHCDTPLSFTTIPTKLYLSHDQGWLNGVSFTWLGVAQRDLPGIRVKVISGAFTWFVKVAGGVVTIYTEDGTKTFSTSGTLNAVANAINASSINTWIQARCSGWQTSTYLGTDGETNGNLAAGKNEWDYVFTKNDPSTLLKDLGDTYINVICADSNAPSGWSTSTRLPIYTRGDTLPPRGIVIMRTLDSTDIYFNTKYSTYPALKFYDNTEAGALSFITEPIYSTPTQAWGGDASWNGFTSQLDVFAGTGYSFDDLWGGLTTLTRYNNGAANFNKSIPYFYNPLSLDVYNEAFFGTCNYCQDFMPDVACFQDNCSIASPSCSPACALGCDFNACGVYCFASFCSYPTPIFPPTPPSCVTDSACIQNYSYYTLGSTTTTTPPSSGVYQASVAVSARFL